MYTGVLPVYILYEVVKFPETGVTDYCKLSHCCWELNLGPLEEQPMLFSADSSPQSQGCLL